MLKIRQYMCKHSFEAVAEHASHKTLWKCSNCGVFLIIDWEAEPVTRSKHKTPHIDGWIYNDGHKSTGFTEPSNMTFIVVTKHIESKLLMIVRAYDNRESAIKHVDACRESYKSSGIDIYWEELAVFSEYNPAKRFA